MWCIDKQGNQRENKKLYYSFSPDSEHDNMI